MITYIKSRQLDAFDDEKRKVVGYGCADFYVNEIGRNLAVKTIKENHYSKKVVNSSRFHLGVFISGKFFGVLQFGYLFNPTYHDKIVEGGSSENAMELNRMWLDDIAPKNSESKAISYAIKVVKKRFPQIKWIQSFADERCGGFGIVYQACSFSYYGEHKGEFYELDGEIYHSIQTRRKDNNSKLTLYLRRNKGRMKKLTLRQFRYIRFIDTRWKKKCLLKEQPYPKHYNND
jgi:adenine modification enzyme